VELVRAVLTEVASMFSDEYFHIGVDEVNFRSCWDLNADVSTFLRQKNWNGHDALKYLVAEAAGAVRAMQKIPIVWQEGLEAELPGDHVAQVWQCWGEPNLGAGGMKLAAQRGLHTIQSTCWYLDWDQGWEFFYRRHSFDVWPVGAPGVLDTSVLGGEVALWSERTDDARVLCRIWPRAAAVADRLWADKGREDLDAVEGRMSHFRSRLVQWGIAAAELEPGAKGRANFGSQCKLLPKSA
jgi:hexosaminidase